jgi:polar amino acid transport system permease protein
MSTRSIWLGVLEVCQATASVTLYALLFVFYYALPVLGFTLSAMTVAAMVLGLNTGGYASQAVRAGLQTLDCGQKEAGQAFGLSRTQSSS